MGETIRASRMRRSGARQPAGQEGSAALQRGCRMGVHARTYLLPSARFSSSPGALTMHARPRLLLGAPFTPGSRNLRTADDTF